MKKFVLAAASLSAMLAAVPASAATIVYTLTGSFTGSSGGTPFEGVPGTFTAIGDTSTVFNTADGSRNVVLSSLTVRANAEGAGTYTFLGLTPTSLRFGTNGGYAGFIVEGDGNNPSVFFNTGLSGYDAISNVAPTNVDYLVSNGTFPTLLNGTPTALTITGQSNLRFGAQVEAAAAVPEPATWGMMLLGFGMVGFGMRRRKSNVRTTVSFA